jgi:hypothetical protein
MATGESRYQGRRLKSRYHDCCIAGANAVKTTRSTREGLACVLRATVLMSEREQTRCYGGDGYEGILYGEGTPCDLLLGKEHGTMNKHRQSGEPLGTCTR